MVLFPAEFACSRSLRKTIRNGHYATSADRAFSAIIRGCAAPRRGAPGTWLNSDMILAYEQLHALGYAHSIESYEDGQLAGGLYGIQLGRVFFGESMFSLKRDASKVAMARLVEECRARDIQLIDCQVASSHLASLGARQLARAEFAGLLRRFAARRPAASWAAAGS